VLTLQWFILDICLCYVHVLDSEQIIINSFLPFWFTFHVWIGSEEGWSGGFFLIIRSFWKSLQFFFSLSKTCSILLVLYHFHLFIWKWNSTCVLKTWPFLTRDGNITWIICFYERNWIQFCSFICKPRAFSWLNLQGCPTFHLADRNLVWVLYCGSLLISEYQTFLLHK
jgi:hypothetical protein